MKGKRNVNVSKAVAQFPHPADAIAAIREAGGVPLLAYPGASLRQVGVTEGTLRPFLDSGTAGWACW